MIMASDLSSYTRPVGDDQLEIELAVEGIACAGCIRRIEGGLSKIPGVVAARVNFTNRRATVAWRKGAAAPADIVAALKDIGYGAHPFMAERSESEEARESAQLLKYLAVSGFAAMNIMLLSVSVWSGNAGDITPETRDLFHWLSALIALPTVAYAGQPFFRSAISALRARAVNMDVPISLGVLLATGVSLVETANHATHAYFDSAVMLLFFLLCGRYLDRALRKKTRVVAGNLAAFRAATAHRLESDQTMIDVPAAALAPGDRIVVMPGERLPADASVISGQSEIDEGIVTGETALRSPREGDLVYAGSLNHSGALTLRVTAAGGRTVLDEIERLLDQAIRSKSRYVALADRAARYYAPVVHTMAALTLAGWLAFGSSAHDAILAAVAVLIITCPCALALAIPAVQVVAAGRLFRSGVILNSGDAIERLAEIDTVVFDKTGTLTLPEARVANAAQVPDDLLHLAARLALSSHHPLARAVARERRHLQLLEGARETAGRGVSAMVDGVEARLGSPAFCGIEAAGHPGDASSSTIAFRHGDRYSIFQIRQTLRPDAVAVVEALRARKIKVSILSGDRVDAVMPVAQTLKVVDWHGGVTPEQKVKILDAMKADGRRVLMVGDGINDAPSLARAHVSISPITAADLTQAQADAVFVGEPLMPVVTAIETSHAARRLMMQNLSLAAIYNAIAVPFAMAGLVTPLIAALAMSGSSLLVTGNAMRLNWRLRAGLDTGKREPEAAGEPQVAT
jgi:Cu2+-exporting ATPase